MVGLVYQHPISEAYLGMGWDEEFKKNGKEIFYILPGYRQVQQMRQRFSEQNGKITFLSFDQFVRRLLGPLAKRLMTPVEQYWLVQQACTLLEEEQQLHYFQPLFHRSENWIQSLEKNIGELKRSGVRSERLLSLWKGRGEKYEELALIYEKYQYLLEQLQVADHEQAYFDLIDQLEQLGHQIQLPDIVVVEHLHDLYPLQEKLLKKLIAYGVEVRLHIIWDEKRPVIYGLVQPIVNRLQTDFHLRPALSGHRRPTNKENSLIHLIEHVFSSNDNQFSANGSIEVISAPGIPAEVDQMVVRLKRWLLQSKSDCSDVAIVAANIENYTPFLFDKLEQAGIPVRTGQTQKLAQHPLFQTILAAFYIKMGKTEWLSFLLYSSYLPWMQGKQQECFQLFRDLEQPHSMQQLEQAWREREEDEERRKLIFQALAKTIQWVEAIPEAYSWSQWMEWFQSWILPLQHMDKWRELAADPTHLRELASMMNAWKSLKDIMQQWRLLQNSNLATQQIQTSRFLTTLVQAAEQSLVQLKPEQRNGVQLLNAKEIRGDQFKAVFVLGCVEGEWPRAYADNWMVPDHERVFLRNEEIILDLSWELRERQLFPFLMSVGAATQFLVLSYTNADEEGKKQLASSYLEECMEIYHDITVQSQDLSAQIGPTSWDCCYSLHSGVGFAIQTLIQSHDQHDISRATQVLEMMSQLRRDEWQSYLDRMRTERSRWSPQFTPFDGALMEPDLIQTIREKIEREVWSVSTVKELLSCRFSFMMERLVGTGESNREALGFTRLEESKMLHEVLGRFWNDYRHQKWNFEDVEHAEQHLQFLIEETMEYYLVKNRKKQRNSLYLRIEKERLKRKIMKFWEHEKYWRNQIESTFRPAYLELSFGMPIDPVRQAKGLLDPQSKSEPILISLPNSTKSIRLKGKIDRVDMDDEGYFAIYDYKLGSGESAAEIKEGRHPQLPLYLWALEGGFDLTDERVIGAAYFSAGDQEAKNNRNQGLWKKELAGRVKIGERVSSNVDTEEWQKIKRKISSHIVDSLQQIEKGDFTVQPTWTCSEYCSQRHVCRFDKQRIDLKKTVIDTEGESR